MLAACVVAVLVLVGPVVEERTQQAGDRRPAHRQVRVTPLRFVAGVAGPFLRDSHAAAESDRVVAHQDLAMRAPVRLGDLGHLLVEERPEPTDITPGFGHLVDQRLVDLAGADGVEQDPHPTPPTCRVSKFLGKGDGDVARPVHERDEVDRPCGISDRGEHRREDLVAVAQDLDLVAERGRNAEETVQSVDRSLIGFAAVHGHPSQAATTALSFVRVERSVGPGSCHSGNVANAMIRTSDPVDFTNPIDVEHAIRIGRAWIELRRGAWAHHLRGYLFGDDDPLEPGQMDTLDLLARRDRTMKQLAERLRIDPSSATRAVQRLVAEGLAERYAADDDRRIVMVRISDHGRDRHAAVDARRAHAMAQILSEFSFEERADLAGLLDRLVLALDDSTDRLS